MLKIKEGLSYDDVLLEPKYSTINSRSQVDLSVQLGKFKFAHPIIPANMKNVTGFEMALEVAKSKGLALLHRFMPIEDQLKIAEDIVNHFNYQDYIGMSLGIKDNDREAAVKFMELGIKIVCVDVAHGDSQQCVEMVEWLKQETNLFIIAGNVATRSGAIRLWEAGADVVKAGVGSGSICSTRIETGNGVPQMSVIMEIAEAKQFLERIEQNKYTTEKHLRRTFPFITDGGIKKAGDCVKGLCFADMVMAGNCFAGSSSAPGKICEIDGMSYKYYAGSSTHKTNHVEGVVALVPTKGSFHSILNKLLEGIRSGCSYQNAVNLDQLKKDPQFIKITNSGLVESHPHDVKVIE